MISYFYAGYYYEPLAKDYKIDVSGIYTTNIPPSDSSFLKYVELCAFDTHKSIVIITNLSKLS